MFKIRMVRYEKHVHLNDVMNVSGLFENDC